MASRWHFNPTLMPSPKNLFSLLAALVFTGFASAQSAPARSGGQESAGFGRLMVHGGVSGLFDSETNPALAMEYRLPQTLGGMHPWIGGSWATDGAVFAGAGLVRKWAVAAHWEISVGFGPGYYDRREGLDLGSHLEFYSFAEAGWEIVRGQRVVLRLAHISNGSLGDTNPGTELLTLGYSVELR
jgi:hypothetical protein